MNYSNCRNLWLMSSTCRTTTSSSRWRGRWTGRPEAASGSFHKVSFRWLNTGFLFANRNHKTCHLDYRPVPDQVVTVRLDTTHRTEWSPLSPAERLSCLTASNWFRWAIKDIINSWRLVLKRLFSSRIRRNLYHCDTWHLLAYGMIVNNWVTEIASPLPISSLLK